MIARLQTKASRSKRAQAKQNAQFDVLEARLERWAFPKIRKELNIIARDSIKDFNIGGVDRVRLNTQQDAQKRIEELLNPIYDKAIKNAMKIMKKDSPEFQDDLEAIENRLKEQYKGQAKKMSRLISKTTTNRIEQIEASGKEQGLTDEQIEKEMRRKLRSDASVRAKVISQVETGSATQESRNVSAEKVMGSDTLKVWVTRRDSKVRDPHQDAEGQTVMMNEKFVINGPRQEEIPYPRYRGASAWNRINCRCRLRYEKV